MSNLSTRTTNAAINQSSFQLYSIGIVANNKELNSNWIEAFPIEDAMGLSGELTDHLYEYKSKGKDGYGNQYETNVKTAATIKCIWLGMGDSNRMTAPDVRRDEMVRIYRVADSENYYWDVMGSSFAQRRLETVVHAYSATKEEDVELNEDNSYVTEVSTHKKLMRLAHTTMANGEPFAYDVFVNAKEGQVVIKDNIDNMFVLNSKDNHIYMINNNKTLVEIKQDEVTIKSKTAVNIHTKKLKVVADTEMEGDTDVTGKLTGGEVKEGSIRLGTHTHTGRGVGRPT